jgi:purine-binding chemotaxis protein CheW
MKEKVGTPGAPARTSVGNDRMDWVEIHQRLEFSQAILERKLAPGPKEKEAILRARAKLLAHEPKAEEKLVRLLDVVEFLLANEHYAIESRYLREVYPVSEITPLPGTPPFVLGLVNFRGQILSVIDLRKFFDLPERGLTDLNKLIVVHSEGMELGILADAIVGARAIAAGELQAALTTMRDVRTEYLKGIAKGPLVVLDINKILSDPRLIVDEDVSRTG